MGYFNLDVRVDQTVEVELDTDEVLGNMDEQDILYYIRSHISLEEILDTMDPDEVREAAISRMDHETMQREVLKDCSIPTLLRAIADKLDNQ